MSRQQIKVGIDVGGTFTDLFTFDESTAQGRTAKTLTTPDDLTRGVLTALELAEVDLRDVSHFVHGSTTATNALIERRFPEPALITTTGFRDTIEIGRMHRETLYDPYQTKPRPLIRRRNRHTVDERIRADGSIRTPLDREQLRAIATRLRDQGVRSVAVGFINSYANPEHEIAARDILLEVIPGVQVALSSDIPKFRELGRFTTCVVRAALLPVMGDYLERLESALQANGFGGRFFVIKSNGGTMSAAAARLRPEELIESGPAGGVAAAAYISELVGHEDLILTDMGGTSFDVCLVENGMGLVRDDYEIEWDMPIITPMLDIRSIGSGGGSIAWVDAGGSLRVGPQSAGSTPGPACYGLGGTQPTVTDANLILGRLDPSLGGKMDLDYEAAKRAIDSVAGPLGLDTIACADGIIHICAESMAAAIKMVSVDRGRDPRDTAIVSFGGAGAMHAWAIAPAVGIDRIIVPPIAGVASAFGATTMDVRHDLDSTFYMECDDADLDGLSARFAELEDSALERLREDGFGTDDTKLIRTAGMRYVGQSYEVDTNLPDGPLDAAALEEIVRRFNAAHLREHGVSSDQFKVAFVNLRVTGLGQIERPPVAAPQTTGGTDGDALTAIENRSVYFAGEHHDTPVYDGHRLTAQTRLEGPAVLEYVDNTVIVPPAAQASVDDSQILTIRLAPVTA